MIPGVSELCPPPGKREPPDGLCASSARAEDGKELYSHTCVERALRIRACDTGTVPDPVGESYPAVGCGGRSSVICGSDDIASYSPYVRRDLLRSDLPRDGVRRAVKNAVRPMMIKHTAEHIAPAAKPGVT